MFHVLLCYHVHTQQRISYDTLKIIVVYILRKQYLQAIGKMYRGWGFCAFLNKIHLLIYVDYKILN